MIAEKELEWLKYLVGEAGNFTGSRFMSVSQEKSEEVLLNFRGAINNRISLRIPISKVPELKQLATDCDKGRNKTAFALEYWGYENQIN